MATQTFKNAIARGVLDDAVTVGIQTKKYPIHQGHIDLINFAKQYGNVVVTINDLDWLRHFINSHPGSREQETPSQSQLDSLKPLGVKVVHQKFSFSDEEKIELVKKANAIIEPLKNQLILQRKIEICRSYCVRFLQFLSEKKKPSIKYLVSGPDVDYFFLKEAFKDNTDTGTLRFPKNKILYPKVSKDPNTLLRYQTSSAVLTPEEIGSCKELAKIISRVREKFIKGSNISLVNNLNMDYSNKPWRIGDITVFKDGIFGESILEVIGLVILRDGIVPIAFLEEMNYIP